MKAPRQRISKTIADATLKSGISKRYSQEIAAYLLSERRVNQLDSIVRDVQADWAANGYVEVLASSAHPITESVRTEISRQIRQLYPEAKQIIVTEVHDPKIMGSVSLSLANQQLDLSVEAKLNKFKQLMTTAN